MEDYNTAIVIYKIQDVLDKTTRLYDKNTFPLTVQRPQTKCVENKMCLRRLSTQCNFIDIIKLQLL